MILKSGIRILDTTYMRQFEEELTNAVTSSAVAAVHDLTAGRFAAHIVGVAADLGLADQIQSAPKQPKK